MHKFSLSFTQSLLSFSCISSDNPWSMSTAGYSVHRSKNRGWRRYPTLYLFEAKRAIITGSSIKNLKKNIYTYSQTENKTEREVKRCALPWLLGVLTNKIGAPVTTFVSPPPTYLPTQSPPTLSWRPPLKTCCWTQLAGPLGGGKEKLCKEYMLLLTEGKTCSWHWHCEEKTNCKSYFFVLFIFLLFLGERREGKEREEEKKKQGRCPKW